MIEEVTVSNPDDGFPPKPDLAKSNSKFMGLLISLVLFILAYYIFFDKNLKLIFIVVIVLFIHELGHFLAMKYFRYTEVKMFFIPFLGALVTGEKHEVSQRQRAIILLAGPVPGILIGGVLYYIGISTGNRDVVLASGMFVALNALNLLPITPLDGGKLVETLFFRNQAILTNIFTIISGLVVVGVALKYEMYTLLIIPFLMLSRLTQFGTVRKVKANLIAQGLDYNKSYEEMTNREYWLIREQVVSEMSGFRMVDGKLYQPDPREQQIAQQVKALAERHPKQDLGVGGTILFTLIWIVFLGVPAAGIFVVMYSRM